VLLLLMSAAFPLMIAAGGFDLLSGQATTTVDGVMGGSSSAQVTCTTSTDTVMGGSSSAECEQGDSLRFSGYLNITDGGFAYTTLRYPSTLDISATAGIRIDLEPMSLDVSSNDECFATKAPLGLELEIEAPVYGCCGLSTYFALPASYPAEATPAPQFVPTTSWQYKTVWYDNVCCNDGNDASLDSVNLMSVGLYWQEGPYEVKIDALTAVDTAVSVSDLLGAAPSTAAGGELATAVMSAAVSRADSLLAYGDAWSALAVVETAAAQCANTLVLDSVTRQMLGAAAETSMAFRLGEADADAPASVSEAIEAVSAALTEAAAGSPALEWPVWSEAELTACGFEPPPQDYYSWSYPLLRLAVLKRFATKLGEQLLSLW